MVEMSARTETILQKLIIFVFERSRAYQGLESVRLPKKLPGSGPEKHRGFAFVEFLTAEQAEVE